MDFRQPDLPLHISQARIVEKLDDLDEIAKVSGKKWQRKSGPLGEAAVKLIRV